MEPLDIRFWGGTELTLAAYLASVKAQLEREKVAGFVAPQAQSERPPRLFTRAGSVGIITIAGPLNNSDSWRNEYMGATGYPEIREALVHAARDTDVKHIVLDIKSGGGSVAGVSDTADLIRNIRANVKPVSAFSDGMVCSAAYWLASAAGQVVIGKIAEAGSIGIITVHTEMSKMYEAMGITQTVIRAGRYKAMGNPAEPLSEEARAEIQGQVDQMYGMFVQDIADARGVSYAVADQRMAQGRVFIGQAAVDVGLVDEVSNFDAFVSKLERGIDAEKASPKYGANLSKGTQVKNALTEAEIAAIAAGGVQKTPEEIAAEKAAADKAAAEKAEADKAASAEKTPEQLAAEQAAASEAAKTGASGEVVAMLQGQLRDANAQIVQLNVELQGAKAASEKLKAAGEKMKPVVMAAVSNLRVALGQSAAGVDALAEDALVAEHGNLAAQFNTKFKAGGVAAVSSSAEKGKDVEAPSALRQARLAATVSQ